jgi:DNA-binding MurR/RpiR family transcriptional regulator
MAHEMFNRLFRLGIKAQVQTDSYLQVMQASLLTPRDVLVVISQTGDSADPRLTAMTARKNGVPVICITGSAVSPLVEHADVVLLSVSQESMAETLSSRIAQYALIHALYVCLALRSLDHAMENEQTIWRAMMHKPVRRDGSASPAGEGEL